MTTKIIRLTIAATALSAGQAGIFLSLVLQAYKAGGRHTLVINEVMGNFEAWADIITLVIVLLLNLTGLLLLIKSDLGRKG